MGLFIKQENRNYTEEEAEVLIGMLPGFVGTSTNFTSAKAIENSDVFTVINLLASDVASLDIQLFESGVQRSDDLLNLLNVGPNGLYSGGTLKFILTANALLNGESFCEIVRNGKGKPIALYHRSNSQVTVKQDADTNFRLVYDLQESEGKTRRLKSTDILHFKFFTLDGIRGISPLKSLGDDLSMQKDSKRFLANFFRNDTQTGGLLKMKQGKLSKEARDKIKDEWQKSNAGVSNAHKVLVIDDTFDYEPIEVNTEVLKLINASTYSTETIGKVYRVPRHKLGLETSNMSLEQANLDYLTSTLNSYLKVITNEVNYKLTSNFNTSFKFDTAPFQTTDVETHNKIVMERFDKGVISLDETRKQIGEKPRGDDHGKKHFISLNYTTLDQLEEYQMIKAKSALKGGEKDGQNGTKGTDDK